MQPRAPVLRPSLPHVSGLPSFLCTALSFPPSANSLPWLNTATHYSPRITATFMEPFLCAIQFTFISSFNPDNYLMKYGKLLSHVIGHEPELERQFFLHSTSDHYIPVDIIKWSLNTWYEVLGHGDQNKRITWVISQCLSLWLLFMILKQIPSVMPEA